MVYFRTFISEIDEKIVPIINNGNSHIILPWENHKNCGFDEIFIECEELKEKEYLNVTNLKENLSPELSFKGKIDFQVSLRVDYLFIPYTKFIYTTILFDFNNGELVKGIFDDGLFDKQKYIKYFTDFAIRMIKSDFKLKNEIKVINNRNNVSLRIGDWSDCRYLDVITDYKYDDFISIMYYPTIVAQQNIIINLINKINDGFKALKCDKKTEHNNNLLELKKEYIDFLTLSNRTAYRNDGKKSENYEVLYKLFNIEALNNEYLNLLKNYEDLVKTVVDQKNLVLGDTLNTIQISSVVLTVVGWILVIMQHDLPSRVPTYIISILLCSLVSVTIAIVIKKIIDRR